MDDTKQYPDGPYQITYPAGNVHAAMFLDNWMNGWKSEMFGLDALMSNGCTLTPLVPAADLDAARQRIADLEAEVERLRQPQMPQPDWSQAPEWAMAHVFWPEGTGTWLSETPTRHTSNILGVGWRASDKCESQRSHLTLPLGIDWRTTLTQRPQEAA